MERLVYQERYRSTAYPEKRIEEAAKLGFTTILLSQKDAEKEKRKTRDNRLAEHPSGIGTFGVFVRHEPSI